MFWLFESKKDIQEMELFIAKQKNEQYEDELREIYKYLDEAIKKKGDKIYMWKYKWKDTYIIHN